MAVKDIIQKMILQLGQSQKGRMPKELDKHFADVDERTTEELLIFTRKFAETVNYYRDTISAPSGKWANFFPDEAAIKQLLADNSGNITPHLALFLTFLELYKKPQEVINRITGRHLDFYYRQVLRMQEKAAVADKAHVVLELKKNVSPISILPEHFFSAGKDNTGIELIYAPSRETVINHSRIDSLQSIFLDKTGHGRIHYAPVANSADGVGGKLQGDEPKWYGFGHAALPQAEVGFAIASSILRMQEGTRTVTVKLALDKVDPKLNDSSLRDAFAVLVTGEKGWQGPYSISATLSDGNVLQLKFKVPASEKAVIDYNAAIHGYDYATPLPIMRVLLKTDSANIGYNNFRNVTLQKASIEVNVEHITSLKLESDSGALDPKKAFMPFGPLPTVGSRFLVGCSEALSKKLSNLSIMVKWKDAPLNFTTHYSSYGNDDVKNSYFTATVVFKDGGGWENSSSGVPLFESNNASSEHTFLFSVQNLSSLSPGIIQDGFITFSLEKDFLHATYRIKYVEYVMKFSTGKDTTLVILNEPYTPTIQSISLSYTAYTDEVNIASVSPADFSNPDIQFFHIAYLGQMREHGYQREQFSFLTDKSVSFLPVYNNEGELLIGFSSLNAGDSVSVLFQVAEGSDDPDLDQENIDWYVLCDNYWKPLGSSEVMLDTTNQLLTSGTIKFVIPTEATTHHTILPTDHIWIKAAISQHVNAVCQLIEVVANAVEVKYIDQGNDPNHLATALKKGRITKLKNGLPTVKTVTQPYASFGGRPVETDDAFSTRVAERLRHKNRCITPWDYERIILEAFPNVHRVKCIPHAKDGSWLAPGHVLIVVIPDLKNKNARDPLQPKVNADTLEHITTYVQERTGMQVKVTVKNPIYQKILLDFKVKFYSGREFNYYSEMLKQELIRFLSPWAYAGDRDISFGGKVYKSVLLDFVEDLDYVDYITDFRMYSYTMENNRYDINEAQPETPDAILVSDTTHIINEAA